MAFPGVEDLLKTGRFGAAEELIMAFTADAEGEDRELLAAHLAELAGEYSRLGRVDDAARARSVLLEIAGDALPVTRARADVSLINAWLDQGGCLEALELLRDMPGAPLGPGPLPEGELQRLVMVAAVNVLSALADERNLAEAEALFGALRGKGFAAGNSDLMALAALNAVIVFTYAGRRAEAEEVAREMEGYGKGEETARYCAMARKIVSGMGPAPV
ncbi:MAG: hypothetical protein LBR80_12030 [Deltaproteobacteria bacterium]|jgi:hypothetical protein|nr:hypothetical protein [Deltaproteobacteria bacterium]